MTVQLLNLVEYGKVLSTRELGRQAADQLQDALVEGGAVVLNFAGVEVASTSFLDEVVMRLKGTLGGRGSSVVVVAGLIEEVQESLILVLNNRKLALAALDEDKLTLLGGNRQLEETLDAASRLGETFKAPDLAESLRIKLPNLHQRLKSLTEGGAIARADHGIAPAQGRAGDFTTFDPKNVHVDELEPRKLVPA